MIEVTIKNFLDGHLDVPSFFERQEYMPKTFIMIEKTNGAMKNKLKTSTFAIQSYAASLYAAAELNERIKVVMDGIVIEEEVSGIYLNADYNFTDVETKEYRYQAVFDIYHY